MRSSEQRIAARLVPAGVSLTRPKRLLLVALLMLLAGCHSPSSHDAAPAIATDASNRAAAEAESTHLLAALTPPPRSKVLRAPPIARFSRLDLGIDWDDPSLIRAAWWTVPMRRGAFVHWLRRQHPTGLRSSPGESNIDGQAFNSWNFTAAGTSSYTAPTLNVSYTPYGDKTAVRLETFLAARLARTVFVPTDTTAVRIVRTIWTGHPGRDEKTSVTVTGPAEVARLVGLANELQGFPALDSPFSCPPISDYPIYTATFIATEGTISIVQRSPCPPALTVEQHGAPTGPMLEKPDSWVPALAAHFAGS